MKHNYSLRSDASGRLSRRGGATHARFLPLRALTCALLATGVMSPTLAAPSAADVKLRALGNSGLSPLGQAVVGAEVVDTRALRADTEAASKASLDYNKQVEATRRTAQPNASPDAKADAIAEMSKRLEEAQKDYEKRRTEIEGAFSWQEGARGYIDISPQGGASSSLITRAATKIFTAATARSSGEDLATQLKAAKADYDKQVVDAVTYALARADAQTRAKWVAQRSKLKDADVPKALDEILGANGGFFNTGLTSNMSPEAREAIANAKIDILKQGLGLVAAKNDAQLKQLESTVSKGFDGTNKRLDVLAKDFKSLDVRLTQNSTALAALATQAQTSYRLLSAVQANIEQVNGQVGAMQSAMFRTMSPAEQVRALDDGFFPNLVGPERTKMRQAIAQTASVLALRDEALGALEVVGGVGRFAKSIGIPVDTYNLDRNIKIASAAVNVVASLATGNYVGAIMQVGGLFPGDEGPDPMMQAMNAKLDRIIELQYQILDAIQALSRQVAESTYAVITKLDGIEAKVDLGNNLALSLLQRTGTESCKQFVRQGQLQFQLRGGLFPTYDRRREHFAQMLPNEWFKQCTAYLYSAATVAAAKGNVATNLTTAFVVDAALLAVANQDKPATDASSYGWRFTNMREYTWSMLNVRPDAKPNCANRAIARLTIAPQLHSLAEKNDIQCQGADIAADGERMKLADGKVLNVTDAMEYALGPGAVREVGEYMLFIGPYHELVKKNRDGVVYTGLYTRQELAEGKGNANAVEPVAFSQGYLDVLNLALAQQTLLAGVYLARPTAAFLQAPAQRFGTAAPFPPVPAPAASGAEKDAYAALTQQCSMAGQNYTNYPYVLTICLMQQNVAFRTNVVNSLVRSALKTANASTLQYDWALHTSDASNIGATLPGLPLARVTIDNKEQWALELVLPGTSDSPAKKSWHLPLPTAPEMRSGYLAYPFSTQPLREMRERTLERYLIATQWQAIESSNTRKFYLRQAVLNDPSYVEVPFLTAATPDAAAARPTGASTRTSNKK